MPFARPVTSVITITEQLGKTNTILPLNDWVTRSSLNILRFAAWARFPVSSVSLHLHGLQCKANSCGNGRTITGHKCIFSVCKSLKWFWSCILMTSNDELLIGHARSLFEAFPVSMHCLSSIRNEKMKPTDDALPTFLRRPLCLNKIPWSVSKIRCQSSVF